MEDFPYVSVSPLWGQHYCLEVPKEVDNRGGCWIHRLFGTCTAYKLSFAYFVNSALIKWKVWGVWKQCQLYRTIIELLFRGQQSAITHTLEKERSPSDSYAHERLNVEQITALDSNIRGLKEWKSWKMARLVTGLKERVKTIEELSLC